LAVDVLAWILIGVSFVAVLVGGIWLIVVAFRQSFLWGCGSLVLPLVGLFFVIKYWADAKKPFLIYMGGNALLYLSVALVPNLLGTDAFEATFEEEDLASFSQERPRRPPPQRPPTGPPPEAPQGDTGDPLDAIAPPAGANGGDSGTAGTLAEAGTPGSMEAPPPGGGLPPPALPPAPGSGAPEEPRRVVGPTVSTPGGPGPDTRQVQIAPHEVARYVGQILEVVTIEGQRQRVTLVEVEPDRLHFDADGIRYSLPAARIKELWNVHPE
jgi:hypothetical protein